MIVKPRIRGFVCITAHPKGCEAKVRQEIEVAKAAKKSGGPKKVLVIGSSTGYGLSTRIASAFGHDAATLGVFYERPSIKGKPASAGWYNSVAFEKAAHEAGLYAKSINGDAFSDEIKAQTIETIKADLGQVDLVVYSLASPRRTDPKTGETYKSVLKPIGESFTNRSLDTDKDQVCEVTIEPAEGDDVEHTIKVMGGEDWELWMDALDQAGVLAPGAKSVAYSYIGPELTWPVYTNGTIGQAKKDVERAAAAITEKHDCAAYVAVNKAVVTQASSAIPVVPLYISILFKIMKAKGTHEDCIEQMVRLLNDRLYGDDLQLDEVGRIRVDDWEMEPDVQQAVADIWPGITSETLFTESDYAGYQENFLTLFGFSLPGVDYEEDVEVDLELPSSK
ncbi:trans-2-enoyl-CoA reductase family protein [Coraliomargarita sp. SDUM461003]|uniref:Enoyl-[acyl-carrier-protein] reductase [NADH] n=1 Tax=Thalassobacterium maritimum TaxID=3041265 RepID=A0ABU1ASA9_9BACT|nr:enoyl-ACP reductase FabV [Coraliomargarita sp. SDUM461003]MBT64390.1 enoyl-[acyl-carrier-protein] reductase FabV [Puniceicoccaceae bacterium]MDQ8206492.1 trans-2-enoyl-CoA reductase family protein [Coraliomargarita sp. SDUM461003]HBR92947.1 bifunctional NADH-specific enoyl-ACP reductase/trans-2-enoyl-CoA reductase [Opitutae bacterium]|tara:strand:+ start:3189 stop:4367 length:1179 start_codon:yes stop_codon:yes gene_type:complete